VKADEHPHGVFFFGLNHRVVFQMLIWLLKKQCIVTGGPGSSVGIVTGYGLDGPGIEFRWGRDFPHLSRPTLGPTQPTVQWVPGISRWYKAAGA
jgi:hypothetical protein